MKKLKTLFAFAIWSSSAGVACLHASVGHAYASSFPAQLGTVLPDPSVAQEVVAGFVMLVSVQYIRRVLS